MLFPWMLLVYRRLKLLTANIILWWDTRNNQRIDPPPLGESERFSENLLIGALPLRGRPCLPY